MIKVKVHLTDGDYSVWETYIFRTTEQADQAFRDAACECNRDGELEGTGEYDG